MTVYFMFLKYIYICIFKCISERIRIYNLSKPTLSLVQDFIFVSVVSVLSALSNKSVFFPYEKFPSETFIFDNIFLLTSPSGITYFDGT